MSTTKSAPPLKARPLTDDPTVEAQPLRGLLFGMVIAALFWLVMAALALTLF